MKRNIILLIGFILLTGCGKKLTCSDDFLLEGDKCIKTVEEKEATLKISCLTLGYELNAEKTSCIKTEKVAAKVNYSCENGYSLNGQICSKVDTVASTTKYKCNSGTLSNNKCISRVADLDAVICTKYCPVGTLSNGMCDIAMPAYASGRCGTGYTMGYDRLCHKYTRPVCKYSCARGEQIDAMCYSNVATNAISYQTCPSGYTLSGTKCIKNITKQAKANYSCESGYTLNNKECVKTYTENIFSEYVCESEEYVLENEKCYLYEIQEPVYK